MRKLRSLILAGILAIGLVTGVPSAFAAAGSLDSTFGRGGKVVTSFANSAAPFRSAVPADAALQSDGKILVAVGFDDSTIAAEAFGLVRRHIERRPDAGFGLRLDRKLLLNR